MPKRLLVLVTALLLMLAGLAATGPAQAAVKRKVTISAPSNVNVGTAFRIRGKVSKTRKGSRVVLQRKVGRKWKKVARTKTGRKGVWRVKVTAQTAGSHTYRAVAAGYRKGKRKKVRRAVSRAVTLNANVPPPPPPPPPPAKVLYDLATLPVSATGNPSFVEDWSNDFRGNATGASHFWEATVPTGVTTHVATDLRGSCTNVTLGLGNETGTGTVTYQVTVNGQLIPQGARAVTSGGIVQLDIPAEGVHEFKVTATTTGSGSARAAVWGTALCNDGLAPESTEITPPAERNGAQAPFELATLPLFDQTTPSYRVDWSNNFRSNTLGADYFLENRLVAGTSSTATWDLKGVCTTLRAGFGNETGNGSTTFKVDIDGTVRTLGPFSSGGQVQQDFSLAGASTLKITATVNGTAGQTASPTIWGLATCANTYAPWRTPVA